MRKTVEREEMNSAYSMELVFTHSCSECGIPLAEDDNYCPNCGGRIL